MEIISLFSEHGFDLTKFENVPLFQAVYQKNMKILEFMLELVGFFAYIINKIAIGEDR